MSKYELIIVKNLIHLRRKGVDIRDQAGGNEQMCKIAEEQDAFTVKAFHLKS